MHTGHTHIPGALGFKYYSLVLKHLIGTVIIRANG